MIRVFLLVDGIYMKLMVLLVMIFFFTPANSNALPNVIERIKGSVVAVGTFMPKRSPRSIFLGTGFTVGNGRLIVTNAQVLPKKVENTSFESIAIFVREKKKVRMVKAKVVAIDSIHDIAILRLAEGVLPAVVLSDDNVREGKLITFTGFPIGMVLGLYPVTHQGIVSAISPVALPVIKCRQLNAKLLRRLRAPFDVYQLDATAYPGNSGSPVYRAETGRVIGIINKVFVKESKENVLSKPSGITYAIPIRYLNDLLKKYNLI